VDHPDTEEDFTDAELKVRPDEWMKEFAGAERQLRHVRAPTRSRL
jgi:hypothetical protein